MLRSSPFGSEIGFAETAERLVDLSAGVQGLIASFA